MSSISERFNFEDPTHEIVATTTIAGKRELVNVLSIDGDYATVQAYGGAIFDHCHYGKTDTATVLKTALSFPFERLDAKPRPQTVLDLALAAEKDTWFAGEKAWIYGKPGDPKGCYLSNEGGAVYLRNAGNQKPKALIFTLDGSGWRKARNVATEYANWKQAVKS